MRISGSAPVKVVTFNTAVGNPAIKTPQAAFPQLPFYAKAIAGAPDAPILCLQEVGMQQRDAVRKLVAASPGATVLYQRVGVDQGNMLVIPKRYQVESTDAGRFGWQQVRAIGRALKGWLGGGPRPKLGQLLEPRGFQVAQLRDTVSGKRFTVVNTHLSYEAGIQEPQAKKLFERANAAAAGKPLIVAGDLNARTPETDDGRDAHHAVTRGYFGDMLDMGPKGLPPGKSNIDWVLARGFAAESSKWYTGTDLSLPGSPDAKTVSDHYAEEDVLTFK